MPKFDYRNRQQSAIMTSVLMQSNLLVNGCYPAPREFVAQRPAIKGAWLLITSMLLL